MDGDWERLGAAVRRERIRAGFRSIEDFAKAVEARTGHYLSGRTVANLERGQRVNDRSLQLVSDALQWPTEAVKDVLGGGLVYITYVDARSGERSTRSLTQDTADDVEMARDDAGELPVGSSLDAAADEVGLSDEERAAMIALIRARRRPPE